MALNFLRTGLYYRSLGNIGSRTANGYWWSDTSFSATNGRFLRTYPTGVISQSNDYHGYGFAVRCVVREG